MNRSSSKYLFTYFLVGLFMSVSFSTAMFVSIDRSNMKNKIVYKKSVLTKYESKETSKFVLGDYETVEMATISADIEAKIVKPKREIPLRVGIITDDYSNQFGIFDSLESETNRNFSSVTVYYQFGNPANMRLNFKKLEYVKNSGKKLIITWEPTDPRLPVQTRDFLGEISAGVLDSYIIDFATDIKNWGERVGIRFGHEMNGDWYPWGNRPEEYKHAYIYLHNKFEELGVKNVDWIWNVNAENVPTAPYSRYDDFYPGDEYVDFIGIDTFNFGTSAYWSSWTDFENLIEGPYNYLSENYNKPLVLSELASSEEGGDKGYWIKYMFELLNNKYVLIEEIVWFNILKEADWRIDSSENSLKNFKHSPRIDI